MHTPLRPRRRSRTATPHSSEYMEEGQHNSTENKTSILETDDPSCLSDCIVRLLRNCKNKNKQKAPKDISIYVNEKRKLKYQH